METQKGLSEDWPSLWIGLAIFVLSVGVFANLDILGWGTKTNVWTKAGAAFSPISPKYSSVSGLTPLLITYGFGLLLMGIGALLLKADLKKAATGFSIVYWISMGCWFLGHYAYIAATPDRLENLNIGWSINLTGGAGYIIALMVGLLVGNFVPWLADRLKEATRPELYIKIAIVIMGGALGLKAAKSLGSVSAVMLRGLCAVVVTTLIFWAFVYWLARKYFRFSREWAAPLASGISIGGVFAAIATAGAIRARPIVPIVVSSLIVVFAAVELILLPWCAKIFLWSEPMVAAAWMGLAVKTDGAAVASGAITDAWIRAKAFAEAGISYKESWMLMTATTIKMLIDILIGVWIFLLAVIWGIKMDRSPGEKIRAVEIWHRFPKFVIGYMATFVILLAICYPASIMLNVSESQIEGAKAQVVTLERERTAAALGKEPTNSFDTQLIAAKTRIEAIESAAETSQAILATAKTATNESNAFKQLFFVIAFFTIGVGSNFKKLWEEGIGKLVIVYLIALFGFVIWIGLVISWICFHGIKPPIAG
jgi:uncharacterized membrane protein YadS